MPIEPSSVSSSAIREVEKPSLAFGSWTSMQGSSTGGKDSPANRIWEKAITGAQKLFGLDSSKAPSIEDLSDTEDNSEKSAKQAYEPAVTGSSGLKNQSYGGFSGTAFGGDTFGSVVTSRAATDPQPVVTENSGDFEVSTESEKPEFVTREKVDQGRDSRNEAQVTKEKPLTEDLVDEEEVVEEKPLLGIAPRAGQRNLASPIAQPALQQVQTQAEPVVLQATNQEMGVQGNAQVSTPAPLEGQAMASAPVAGSAASPTQTSVSVAPTQSTSKQIPASAMPVSGSNLQAPASSQAGIPQQTAVAGVAKEQGPVPRVAEVESKGQSQALAAESPKQVSNSSAETQGLGQSNVGSELAKKGESPSTVAQGTISVKSQVQSEERPVSPLSEGLGVDVAKAKEAVTEGLAKATATATASKPVAVQSQTSVLKTPTQTVGQAEYNETTNRPLGGDGLAPRPTLGGATEGKENSTMDGVKREGAGSLEGRLATVKSTGIENTATARVASAGAEGVAVDVKTVQSGVSTSAGANQFAREAASAAAARMQAPSTQTTANVQTPAQQSGLSGVTATQGASVNANGSQQGGSQNSSSGDPGGKKDLSEVLKQTASGKGAEKLSTDSGQSFEAKVDELTGRRAEAASKARQTSYVSKTAEEVKEVVATLTKSIDRLVTNKAGAMNLKINFEGGGSVNLRISMESGQVSTSMQTDVVGLEAAIKANWGELANDWNQKGVKLHTPQFQNSESGKQSSFEDLNEFASRQDRQAAGQSGDGRGRSSGGQASFNRGFGSSRTSDTTDPILSNAEVKEKIVSTKELKTYA